LFNIHTWKPGHQYPQIPKRGIKSETEAERIGHELANSGAFVRVEMREQNSNVFLQAWSGCFQNNQQGVLV